MATQQFCTFVVDEALFGVEVERVQEILRHQEMTPIPLAPGSVRGLINLRGQIVPAIELRRVLSLRERTGGDALPANVVIRTDDGPVSLLADEIGEVLTLSEETFEPPPDNLGATHDLIRGVYKLEQGLLLVLSTDAAITVSTAEIDDRFNMNSAPEARRIEEN